MTQHIRPIEADEASEASRALFGHVSKKLGRVPNMYKVMANSPAVLDAYLKFNSALAVGSIGHQLAEVIALATAEYNECAYCLSAHTYFGEKTGLSPEAINDARLFKSEDVKVETGLRFVKKLLAASESISPNDIAPLRKAGFTDGEILEIIANVIRNIFTNYLNIVSNTEVDWPKTVEPFQLTK